MSRRPESSSESESFALNFDSSQRPESSPESKGLDLNMDSQAIEVGAPCQYSSGLHGLIPRESKSEFSKEIRFLTGTPGLLSHIALYDLSLKVTCFYL